VPEESANTDPLADASEETQRGRSTIEFPYLDLDNSIEVVKAVHSVEVDRCEWNQLATKLNVSGEGGGFRQRMIAAKVYGLLTYERGQVMLTDLGIRASDPAHEKKARFEAFMVVPLFKQLFDRLNGQPLPPIAAIERMAEGLGVAPKQKDKARQVFQRAAKQAGLFDLASDRLSIPPGLNGGNAKSAQAQTGQEAPAGGAGGQGGGGSGSGGGNDGLHPFIQGLLQKLPKPEAEWSIEARAKWLITAANIFDLMYLSPLDAGSKAIFVEVKQL
jgi:hypothetical protein